MTAFINCHAQQASEVETIVDEIVKKHEGSQGVSSMKVVKGGGLDMLKMMFNKQFGKDFMKGVTSITLIDYSDASDETCMILRQDLDAFLSLLHEFNLSDEEKFGDNDYIRCFASDEGSKTISDFVIAIENEKSKMLMYMAGNIKVE